MSLIGHIDSDCFYVSCERVRRPELRGLPVGVLSNQGACVIAKSYELKAAGVTTAMAIWDALPLCPEAVFVKRDFHWYEVISRSLLELVRSVSPTVEYYSIDEQFFDASFLEQHYRTDLPTAVAKLQQTVLHEIGIPVSIGIAPTKTYAKLCSKASKPFGYEVFTTTETAHTQFAKTPVEELTGIASRSKTQTTWLLDSHLRRVRRGRPEAYPQTTHQNRRGIMVGTSWHANQTDSNFQASQQNDFSRWQRRQSHQR